MGGERPAAHVCPPSEASGTPAKLAGYQEYFAGSRSRPEGSERLKQVV